MDNQKSSPLTSILSPQRGEADGEGGYDFSLSGQKGSPLVLGEEERGRVRS